MMEVTFKKCFKCGLILPISAFYAHPKMLDGHLNKCKTCTRKDVHERYEEKIKDKDFLEKERARGRDKYKRLYSGTKKDDKYGTSYVRKFIERRVGKLDAMTELHHWNYNFKKSVIALDRSVHSRLHHLIKLDDETKIFIIKETGEKLDTLEKHCNFIRERFEIGAVLDF